jgi:hypothetical protein
MKNDDAWVGLVCSVVLLVAIVASTFYAPCGCYAGTPAKDVPLRCTDLGKK